MAPISAGVSAATFGRLSVDHDDHCPSPAGTSHRAGNPDTQSARFQGARASDHYRHDLDGLRGVAILLVAVFHVWFGRVSGGVDVFLALSGFFFGGRLLRTAMTPGASLWPVGEVTRLGSAAAARTGDRARRRGGADDPHPARNPLGDIRRPESGKPGLLPELGVGEHRVGLSARRRGRQSAAAHLVDVGAGPVLHRIPGADLRVRPACSAGYSAGICGSPSSCCSAR